jgi:IS30 family transposase
LARAANEIEIAYEVGVNQSTISRDIKVAKSKSQQFVYELAK